MRKVVVSVRYIAALTVLLFAVQGSDCEAQRNATKRFEKEVFGKSRRSTPAKQSGESRAAAKAMKEQEKKMAQRDREDAKALKEKREHHYEIQSEKTLERMDNNSRNTADKYKVKKQKQRKEQSKPELDKPRQPDPERVNTRVKTKDPAKQAEVKQQKQKAGSKTKDPSKQPALKQQKKAKTVDPKKQKKLKQHKIKKY
jgi:hypothetical protein